MEQKPPEALDIPPENVSASTKSKVEAKASRIFLPRPAHILAESQHFIATSKPAGVASKDNHGQPALITLESADQVALQDDLPKQVPGIVWALRPNIEFPVRAEQPETRDDAQSVWAERTFRCLVAAREIPGSADLEQLLKLEFYGSTAGEELDGQQTNREGVDNIGDKCHQEGKSSSIIAEAIAAPPLVDISTDPNAKRCCRLLSASVVLTGPTAIVDQLAILELKTASHFYLEDLVRVHLHGGRRLDGSADAATGLLKALNRIGLPVVGKGRYCRQMRGVTGKFFVASKLVLRGNSGCRDCDPWARCDPAVRDSCHSSHLGRAELAPVLLTANEEFPRLERVLESEKAHAMSVLPVAPKMPRLQKIPHLSADTLDSIFEKTMDVAKFRWFNGHGKLDFKVEGEKQVQLNPPYDLLQPLVSAMIELAEKTLLDGEELAILQLILNLFKDGRDDIKSHRHRCRQICVSLGASRELHVAGQSLKMCHGDALYLEGEYHSVPPSKSVSEARISVCLFYGSSEEYKSQSIMVNDGDAFSKQNWWCHPDDL